MSHFLSIGVVSRGPSSGPVAETYCVGDDAKIQAMKAQAMKSRARLLEAVDFLERTLGLTDAKDWPALSKSKVFKVIGSDSKIQQAIPNAPQEASRRSLSHSHAASILRHELQGWQTVLPLPCRA